MLHGTARLQAGIIAPEGVPRVIFFAIAAQVVAVGHFPQTAAMNQNRGESTRIFRWATHARITSVARRANPKAAPSLVKIDEHTTVFRSNGFERAAHNFVAVTTGGCEDVAGKAMRMYAHQRGRIAGGFAADEG